VSRVRSNFPESKDGRPLYTPVTDVHNNPRNTAAFAELLLYLATGEALAS
jgi:hypothetical protein